MIIVNFGGGITTSQRTERGQALGKGLSSVRLPKGGQRRKGVNPRG